MLSQKALESWSDQDGFEGEMARELLALRAEVAKLERFRCHTEGYGGQCPCYADGMQLGRVVELEAEVARLSEGLCRVEGHRLAAIDTLAAERTRREAAERDTKRMREQLNAACIQRDGLLILAQCHGLCEHASRVAALEGALREIRNWTGVSAHQIAVIDAALAPPRDAEPPGA